MTGIDNIEPKKIFSDGENYYYSSAENQFKLDKETLVWEEVAFTIPFSFIGQQVWTDGEKTYVPSYVFNKNLGNWEKFSWNGDFHAAAEPYVWTDGENIYYSNGTMQYKLNKETSTWVEQKWNGLTYFLGWDIWTDGQEIYYSKDDLHYKLNKETSTWEEKTWNGITAFEGKDVWYFEDEVYLYRCKLDIDSSTWERFLATSVAGQYIWTDGKNFYYSPGERFNSTYAFSPVDKTFYKVELEGLSISYFSGYYIWTDGENVYYSYGNDHYILSSVVYEKSNCFVNSNQVA